MSDQRDDDDDQGTGDTGSSDDTGDTDQTTEDGDGSEWTPPTREDWTKVTEALRKARREARAAKRPAKVEETGDGGKPDLVKAVADATAAEAGRWKPMLVKTAARTAFVEAGLVLPKGNSDSAMARVVKLLDLDDLQITDDGQIDGLREQVEEIRGDFPELFGTTNGHRRVGRVDGADRSGTPTPKTAVERLTAQIMAG